MPSHSSDDNDGWCHLKSDAGGADSTLSTDSDDERETTTTPRCRRRPEPLRPKTKTPLRVVAASAPDATDRGRRRCGREGGVAIRDVAAAAQQAENTAELQASPGSAPNCQAAGAPAVMLQRFMQTDYIECKNVDALNESLKRNVVFKWQALGGSRSWKTLTKARKRRSKRRTRPSKSLKKRRRRRRRRRRKRRRVPRERKQRSSASNRCPQGAQQRVNKQDEKLAKRKARIDNQQTQYIGDMQAMADEIAKMEAVIQQLRTT